MNRKALRFLAVLLVGATLTGCASQEKDGQETPTKAAAPQPETTRTVTCLSSYISTNGETELHYDFSYEEDGVHIKPNPCVNGYENVYDWDGKLLYEVRYNEEGEKTYRLDHTYDANGNRTELLQTDLSDNSVASRNSYTYDAAGRLTWESYEGRNGYVSYTITYTYDNRGFLSEDLMVNHDGEETWKHTYLCDEAGRILKCEEYVMSDSISTVGHLCSFICTYDDQGRLVSNVWEQARRDSFVDDSQYYTYDSQGRLTCFKRVKFNGDTESEQVYTYDKDGKLLQITDSVTGWNNVLHYTEVTVDAELAQKAEAWALNGALNALVKTPEFED